MPGPAGLPGAPDRGVPVLLASASPRRRDLLGRLGVVPEVRPADVDETPRPGEPPATLVTRLAAAKVAATTAPTDVLVVGADTVVALGARVLGKPTDRADAHAMLTALSGREHLVVTGVAVRYGGRTEVAAETTRVRFRELAASEVAWYLATGEPDDKAGAYGLQGAGAALVERVDGSDTNVIGLPLPLLVALARHVGVDLLAPPPADPDRTG